MRTAGWRSARRAFAELALSVLVLAALPAGSALASARLDVGGQPDVDKVSLTVSPATVAAGSRVSFTVVVRNDPRNFDALTWATVTVPAGFDLRRAVLAPGEPGSATVSGNVITLAGLLDNGGEPLRVTVTAATPARCGTSLRTWSAQAWEGRPGAPGTETLALEGTAGRRRTTLSTVCALSIVTEPHDAVVGAHITGAAYDPSGPPVRVAIVNGAGRPLSWASARITLSLVRGSGGAGPSSPAPGPSGHIAASHASPP